MVNDKADNTKPNLIDKLEKFFLALFLFSIPLQTRLTFITNQTYTNKFFNEYATVFLYLSDILFIITFLLYFVNQKQVKLTKLSSFSKIFNKLSPYSQFIPFYTFFLLVSWGFLSIYWSEYKEVAFYKSVKLTEFGLLFFYITHRLRWFGLKNLFAMVFIAGFFQSIIGILQYLFQRSIGLRLLGESILAPNLAGVAKIVVNGEKIIRAYATFPHPNVFGGFLILSIFLGFWLFFSAQLKTKSKIVSRETFLLFVLTIAIIVQIIAIILTFSRMAWLGSIITIIILITVMPRLFHVKQSLIFGLNKAKIIALTAIFISVSLFMWFNRDKIVSRTFDTEQNYQQGMDNRILYNNIAIEMVKHRPLTGIGNGNFTLEMKNYVPGPLKWWQYQPVHNIYLLITGELGIIGFILFLIFILLTIKMVYLKGKNQIVSRLSAVALAKADETLLFYSLILSVFIGFLFIGLFDHYFWTLQQGQLVFWLVLGILLSYQNVSRETFLASAKEGETI